MNNEGSWINKNLIILFWHECSFSKIKFDYWQIFKIVAIDTWRSLSTKTKYCIYTQFYVHVICAFLVLYILILEYTDV